MSNEVHASDRPVRPSYPQPTRTAKAVMAVVAVFLSTTVLGSVLALFEMRGNEAAIAHATVETQAPNAGLAVRTIDSARRG